MSAEFDFSMDNSLKLAKEILERQTRCRLKSFDSVARSYLDVKGSLLRAINPDNDSGRVVFKVTSFNAEACCREINDTLCHNLWPTIATSPLKQIDGYFVCEEDVKTGLLSQGNRMVAVNDEKGKPLAKPGMKLTKAIQIAIKKAIGSRMDEATIAANMTLIGTILARHKVAMNFCISANILDILLMSSHSSFTSCHRLGGEFCAGPQQYLQDEHTAIAYGWTDWAKEELSNAVLPYKRWRQTIHFNLRNKCACFVRQYSDIGFLEEATHVNIREQAARILARHAKLPSEDPDWYKSEKITSPMVEMPDEGIQLAYIDDPGKHNGSYKIRLSTGLYRKMLLHDFTPCMRCNGEMSSSGYHLCHACVGRKDASCSCCNLYAPEEGAVTVKSRLFCQKCASNYLVECQRCDTLCVKDELFNAEGEKICQSCFRANFYTCANCFKCVRNDSGCKTTRYSKKICNDCANNFYTACAACSSLEANSRIITMPTDGAKVCKTCHLSIAEKEVAERMEAQRRATEAVIAGVQIGAISEASAVEFIVEGSSNAASNNTFTVDVPSEEASSEEMPF